MYHNVPQGLSHCSGRHWRIQRHQKQCRPHLVGNIVFRHKDPQTLQPPGGVQGVKFDPLLFSPKNQSQKIHKRPFPVPKRRRAACFHKFCSASFGTDIVIRYSRLLRRHFVNSAFLQPPLKEALITVPLQSRKTGNTLLS